MLIASRDRINVLALCVQSVLSQTYHPLEIVVLDDGSRQYHLANLLSAQFDDPRLRCLRVEESLGVAGARNLLMQQATGDILCFIDDDAFFQDDQAVARLVEAFNRQPSAGIIAVKVIDHYPTGHMRLSLPFTQRQLRRQPQLVTRPGRVAYYLGTGHAIRRNVLAVCGSYHSASKFGEEELDLSYRAIEAGFELHYLPDVTVQHFPQPSVVTRSGAHRHIELYYHVCNRFYLAYKYLPWQYVPVYLAVWLGMYGWRAVWQQAHREFCAGIRDGLKQLKSVRRTPLSRRAVAYLRNNYGRLWY